MGVIPHRLQNLDATDAAVLGTIGPAGSFSSGVAEPEFDRVQRELLRDFVHHGFGCKCGVGRAGRPIRRRARLVYHHVVAVDLNVGNIVSREDAHRTRPHHRTGIGPGLIGEVGLGAP